MRLTLWQIAAVITDAASMVDYAGPDAVHEETLLVVSELQGRFEAAGSGSVYNADDVVAELEA